MKDSILIPLEILLIVLCGVITAMGLFTLPVLPLFLVAWGSLRLRHMGWRDVGLRKPDSWLKTVGLAVLIGAGYQALDTFFIAPLLQGLTGETIDLSQFSFLKGNLAGLFLFLIITWTEAAFIEEMFFRGYLFNRLTDVFGNQRIGIGIALVVSSLLFGSAHFYQGITGVIDTFLAGLLLGGLYLLTRRNLWLPILTHGIVDTIGFLLIYAGLFTS